MGNNVLRIFNFEINYFYGKFTCMKLYASSYSLKIYLISIKKWCSFRHDKGVSCKGEKGIFNQDKNVSWILYLERNYHEQFRSAKLYEFTLLPYFFYFFYFIKFRVNIRIIHKLWAKRKIFNYMHNVFQNLNVKISYFLLNKCL